MTLAARADAATTRDALAATARLMGLCGDLSHFQPDLTPEPTPSAERRTQAPGGTPVSTDQTDHRADPVQAVAEAHRMHNGQCACGYDPLPGTPFVNDWLGHVLSAARPAIEREAKAAAWDEGFAAANEVAEGCHDCIGYVDEDDLPRNPYRAALTTGTNQQEADQ